MDISHKIDTCKSLRFTGIRLEFIARFPYTKYRMHMSYNTKKDKQVKIMKQKLKSAITLCLVAIIMISMCPFVHAQQQKVIRVGWPIQKGLTEKTEGGYSGYTYDYLKELAQYTGWTYEFVTVDGDIDEQLSKLLQMLEKGEIDLMGAMSNNEQSEKLYDFPSENYGNAYSVLAVNKKEAEIDEFNISDHKSIKVALLKKATNRNDLFFQYADLNGINYEIVWCDDDVDQAEKVNAQKADALLTVNLSIPDDMRSIIKFSPVPFYFATTKGNTEVVSELNQAITYISEVYPTLQSDLYNRYFNKQDGDIYLNSKEQAYIEEHPKLKVLVHDGFGPIEYLDKNNKIHGVAYDILNDITENIGGSLEYVYAKSYEDYLDKINKHEVDLVLSVDYEYDYALKDTLLLSTPYLETEKVVVVNEDVNVQDLDNKIQAIYKGEKNNNDPKQAVYFDSIEETLNAVESGTCDFAYSNSYAASYYQYRNHYEHTIIYPKTINDTVRYSIGIANKNDKILSTIINKGIRSIEPNRLEKYLYQNAQQNHEFMLSQFFKENPLFVAMFVISFCAFIFIVLFLYYKNKIRLGKQLELENTRYRYLSDMMREVTFTYNYIQDEITLSKEGQILFETDETIQPFSKYHYKVKVNNGKDSIYQLLMRKEDIDEEMKLYFPHQDPQWYHIITKVIYDQNKPVSIIGRFQNIHDQKLEKDKLLETSRIDGLTKVLNSNTFKKDISDLLEASDEQYAFAIIDIDDFKNVNDTYGHYEGDQVLITVANAMKEIFQENAFIGRLGGDEFSVFLKYETRERLEELIKMLFQELAYLNKSAKTPIPTLSIGVSIRHKEDNLRTLYQRADSLLYEVKNDGKNNYRIEA